MKKLKILLISLSLIFILPLQAPSAFSADAAEYICSNVVNHVYTRIDNSTYQLQIYGYCNLSIFNAPGDIISLDNTKLYVRRSDTHANVKFFTNTSYSFTYGPYFTLNLVSSFDDVVTLDYNRSYYLAVITPGVAIQYVGSGDSITIGFDPGQGNFYPIEYFLENVTETVVTYIDNITYVDRIIDLTPPILDWLSENIDVVITLTAGLISALVAYIVVKIKEITERIKNAK